MNQSLCQQSIQFYQVRFTVFKLYRTLQEKLLLYVLKDRVTMPFKDCTCILFASKTDNTHLNLLS